MWMKCVQMRDRFIGKSALDLKGLTVICRRKNQAHTIPNRVPEVEFEVAHGPEDNVGEVEADEGPQKDVEAEIHEEARADGHEPGTKHNRPVKNPLDGIHY
jgi:hypothetical protein